MDEIAFSGDPPMPLRIIFQIPAVSALLLISSTVAVAQSSSTAGVVTIPIGRGGHTWGDAQSSGSSKHRLYVVTLDQPQRRQSCHVQSLTAEKLVCSRAIGGPRTYLPQQVLALILPGDGHVRLPIWLALNGGLGAAIWVTVVLTATCPACAAATAFAALLFFGAAGAIAYGDDVPDKLLYLAPDHELSRKLGYVQD
jgi:hypothetical protein